MKIYICAKKSIFVRGCTPMEWDSSHNYRYTSTERKSFAATEEGNRLNAANIIHRQVELYSTVVELKGDILSATDKNRANNDFGYYDRIWSLGYEGYDIKETYKKSSGGVLHSGTIDSSGHFVSDTYDDSTYIAEEVCPVQRNYVESFYHKVVKQGKGKYVKELENKFIEKSDIYYEICDGFSVNEPKKSHAVLYNIFSLLGSLFIFFYLISSPRHMLEYATSLSVDVMLYKLISKYNVFLQYMPVFVTYLSFCLGFVSLIIARLWCDDFNIKYTKDFDTFHLAMFMTCSIVMFGFSFCCNNSLKNFTANNLLGWIPVIIYGGARIIVVLCVICVLFLSVGGLITNYPYKMLKSKVSARADHVDSGEYENCKNLLSEIRSYEVTVDEDFITYAMNMQAKIGEFNSEITRLKNIEKAEFVDKSVEINELNIRLEKAKAALTELLSRKPDNISG